MEEGCEEAVDVLRAMEEGAESGEEGVPETAHRDGAAVRAGEEEAEDVEGEVVRVPRGHGGMELYSCENGEVRGGEGG